MDSKYHFLDSNIFLGLALADSSFEMCKNYFQVNSTKITSDTVEDESKSVIGKFMIVSRSVLKYISLYVNRNHISDSKIHRHISNMEIEFVDSYSNKNYPFGFKKEKFLRLTHELFQEYADLIKKNIFLETLDVLLQNQSKRLFSSYKRALNDLENLFNKVCIYSFGKSIADKQIISQLNDIGIHNPDSRIILDSFKISKIIDGLLLFITNDQDIIDNSSYFTSLFGNRIIPKRPEDLINS